MAVQMVKHAVGGDEHLLRNVLAQNFTLALAVPADHMTEKPLFHQLHVRIIPMGGDRAREENFLPVGVCLVPEDGSHLLVQVFQRAELLLQIRPERLVVALAVVLVDLAVQLIVDLPPDNGGVAAVVHGHLRDNPVAEAQIGLAGIVVVLAQAVAVQHTVLPGIEGLGIFLRQPRGRGAGGGAENDPDSLFFTQVEKTVEKVKGKFPLPGFDFAPGEFADAHPLDAALLHAAQVILPQPLLPMLGIITDPQGQMIQMNRFLHPIPLLSGDSFLPGAPDKAPAAGALCRIRQNLLFV